MFLLFYSIRPSCFSFFSQLAECSGLENLTFCYDTRISVYVTFIHNQDSRPIVIVEI